MKGNVTIVFIISLLLLAFEAVSPQEKIPVPRDFAGQMTLTGPQGSLLVLEIPEIVYQGLERVDLGDIRVFDADGLAVPFTVSNLPMEAYLPAPLEVPFFIWKEARGQDFPGNRDVEIDLSGAIVTIRDTQGVLSDTGEYLIDLSSLSQSPEALLISFEQNNNFFNSTVSIHTSSDLSRWQTFDKQQVVAYYRNTGTDRDRLEVPLNIRYALIKFNESVPPVKAVTAVFPYQTVSAKAKETRITGEKSADGKAVYYNTNGCYPVESIDFRLPEPDSILVNIQNQFTFPDGPYQVQRQERLYRIKSGNGERTSDPIKVSDTGRYWTLTAAGEMPFANIPECYLFWSPLELVFLARGKGPWVLAYGNALYAYVKENDLLLSGEDILVPAIITGENSYTPRTPARESREWSQFILWGILILAAGALSLLAYFAAKSMTGKR